MDTPSFLWHIGEAITLAFSPYRNIRNVSLKAAHLSQELIYCFGTLELVSVFMLASACLCASQDVWWTCFLHPTWMIISAVACVALYVHRLYVFGIWNVSVNAECCNICLVVASVTAHMYSMSSVEYILHLSFSTAKAATSSGLWAHWCLHQEFTWASARHAAKVGEVCPWQYGSK